MPEKKGIGAMLGAHRANLHQTFALRASNIEPIQSYTVSVFRFLFGRSFSIKHSLFSPVTNTHTLRVTTLGVNYERGLISTAQGCFCEG